MSVEEIIGAFQPRYRTRGGPRLTDEQRTFFGELGKRRSKRGLSESEAARIQDMVRDNSLRAVDFRIEFDLDSARIRPAMVPLVEKLAAVLKSDRLATQSFIIGGHTDARGGEKHNAALSLARADAVRTLLMQRYGVPGDRLIPTGFGARYPRDGNDALAAVNRRVEVVGIPGAGDSAVPAVRQTVPPVDGTVEAASPVLPRPVSPAIGSSVDRPAAVANPTAATSPQALRRVALVIGNSDYQQAHRLANPKEDAALLSTVLRQVGFQVVDTRTDLTRLAMQEALAQFSRLAKEADWAVIYYAGHGIQINGVNYTIPVDAALKSPTAVQEETVSLDSLLQAVEGASRLRLVILDACRDNPFAARVTRSGTAPERRTRGLARISDVPSGVLVAYSARDGQISRDGAGSNSPFAEALAQRLGQPSLEINMVFRQVRDDVLRSTAGAQEPWTYGSLPPEAFYFRAN